MHALRWNGFADILVGICVTMAVSVAQAGVLTKGDIVKLDWPSDTYGHANGGGEFAMYKLTGQNAGQDVWQRLSVPSFCVEYNEHLWLGTKMLVGGVSDRAVFGGVSGQVYDSGVNQGDPIDDLTRFLYSELATKSIASSIGFIYGNDSWSNAFQEAIWYIEGEVSNISSTGGQALYNYAVANANSNFASSRSVFVVNLFALDTPIQSLQAFDPFKPSTWQAVSDYRRQDQLQYDPTQVSNINSVPEPVSIYVWSLIFVALIVQSYRSRKRSFITLNSST